MGVLTDEEKKAFQTAISKLYPGERGKEVYDAFFSYVAARKSEWSASTNTEYEEAVKKYYDSALLATSNNSNHWNIFMKASMIGNVATLIILIIWHLWKTFTDQDVRSRLFPKNSTKS